MTSWMTLYMLLAHDNVLAPSATGFPLLLDAPALRAS
jgi:hypothetical protein